MVVAKQNKLKKENMMQCLLHRGINKFKIKNN